MPLSGSPPPSIVVCVNDTVPPFSVRIETHGGRVELLDLDGEAGLAGRRDRSAGATEIVLPVPIRTTAHDSIVSAPAIVVSNGTMCGFPAAVQVSAAVIDPPCMVPAR